MNGVEMFDADDVTAWLQATGRGDNPEAGNDVVAFARMTGPADAGTKDSRQMFDSRSPSVAVFCHG